MFIGHYSLANGLTLFGLLSSVTSCFLAAKGNFKFAVYMLFLACICDMFDGKIARSTPNRTAQQKFYGVQLDSLCDVISFGVTPCFIAFSFGFDGILDVIIYGIFVMCGAIRLAYFNTLANENPGKSSKSFRGVPIPVSVGVVIFLFLLTTFISADITLWIFRIFYLGLAIGFILNIKIKKPDMKKGAIFLAGQIILLILLVVLGDCKMPV
ncbi:MAG: CDP-alcohol phosphatidyltransferase family protein [Clostridia bacterium]|nr:CDP-alcohol phosphatidyltransferase family protein [Clostridia bacterium]